MKVKKLQYISGSGWMQPFPEMDSASTLLLVFAAPEFKSQQAAIKELVRHYPQSHVIGCSTAGEIADSQLLDHSLSVAVAQFEKTSIQVARVSIVDKEKSYDIGQQIVKALTAKDLKAIFLLSDGVLVNGSKLTEGLREASGERLIITGGLAGDGDRFRSTWSIYEDQIHEHALVAVGFYGTHLSVGVASQGGWDIFGLERRITRSRENILYELDHKPALALYKKYLGERARDLPSSGLLFPLQIRASGNSQDALVRTILAVDEEEQALIFAGDMPQGYLAQLMHANFERIIECAVTAGQNAVNLQQNAPLLSIAISCVGRRLLLGERAEEEVESLYETMPKGSVQVGFYSYGEISPITDGRCDLHNQTMTVTTLSET